MSLSQPVFLLTALATSLFVGCQNSDLPKSTKSEPKASTSPAATQLKNASQNGSAAVPPARGALVNARQATGSENRTPPQLAVPDHVHSIDGKSSDQSGSMEAQESSLNEPVQYDVAEGEFPPIDSIFEISNQWKRLGPFELWVDREKHQVIVGGHICLRNGALEMFACPRHTKEHESIVAIHCDAKFVHTALLAVGAKPGKPVEYEPEYRPASGPIVKIRVRWMEDGKLTEKRAQDLVRNIKTGEPMQHDWVFVGSQFWRNPDTGEAVYLGDSGEFICVSNFGSATMDLPVESSSEAAGLLFQAFTDNIPRLGTLVLLVLEPEVEAAKTEEKTDSPAPKSGELSSQPDPNPDK